MNNYYDVGLKKSRLKKLNANSNFYNYKGKIENIKLLENIFSKHKPNVVIHLAAQAGVRYSINNPFSYVESNLIGTFRILEIARKYKPSHLLIASTSSVYGSNKNIPFNECDNTNSPLSFYAATKISNESMAHSYSHLFNIPVTIFRFFTVYGPWGRPDMSYFKFTKNIFSDKPIDVYNQGNMVRDFTYISDLVRAIFLLIPIIPKNLLGTKKNIMNDSISNVAPYRVVNIGNSKPVNLLDFISELEKVIGKISKKNFLGMQDGDVHTTYSDIELLKSLTGFSPKTTLHDGISEFIKWYKSYYL